MKGNGHRDLPTGAGYAVTYLRATPSGGAFRHLYASYVHHADALRGAERLRTGPMADRVSDIEIEECEIR